VASTFFLSGVMSLAYDANNMERSQKDAMLFPAALMKREEAVGSDRSSWLFMGSYIVARLDYK
jgi:hypothetical protein